MSGPAPAPISSTRSGRPRGQAAAKADDGFRQHRGQAGARAALPGGGPEGARPAPPVARRRWRSVRRPARRAGARRPGPATPGRGPAPAAPAAPAARCRGRRAGRAAPAAGASPVGPAAARPSASRSLSRARARSPSFRGCGGGQRGVGGGGAEPFQQRGRLAELERRVAAAAPRPERGRGPGRRALRRSGRAGRARGPRGTPRASAPPGSRTRLSVAPSTHRQRFAGGVAQHEVGGGAALAAGEEAEAGGRRRAGAAAPPDQPGEAHRDHAGAGLRVGSASRPISPCRAPSRRAGWSRKPASGGAVGGRRKPAAGEARGAVDRQRFHGLEGGAVFESGGGGGGEQRLARDGGAVRRSRRPSAAGSGRRGSGATRPVGVQGPGLVREARAAAQGEGAFPVEVGAQFPRVLGVERQGVGMAKSRISSAAASGWRALPAASAISSMAAAGSTGPAQEAVVGEPGFERGVEQAGPAAGLGAVAEAEQRVLGDRVRQPLRLRRRPRARRACG